MQTPRGKQDAVRERTPGPGGRRAGARPRGQYSTCSPRYCVEEIRTRLELTDGRELVRERKIGGAPIGGGVTLGATALGATSGMPGGLLIAGGALAARALANRWLWGVWAVAFSPDGQRLATASADKTARIWSVTTGAQLLTLTHSDAVSSVAFSPDGQRLATASSDKTARIWNAVTGQPQLEIHHDEPVWAVAFSPDGQRLATAGTDKTVRVVDVGPVTMH